MTHRWLGLALYAEGPTDHRFLEEVLRRAVEHILISGGHAVEVGHVQRLEPPRDAAAREDRIARGALAMQGAFHILFVHADSDGNEALAREERVMPGLRAIEQVVGTDSRCGVPVVPVRETEAWALADYERLTRVLGTTLSAADLGLPSSPALLERETDVKALFEKVVARARSGRRSRRRPKPAAFLDLLGESVRVGECSQLPAFAVMLSDLAVALQQLGFRD